MRFWRCLLVVLHTLLGLHENCVEYVGDTRVILLMWTDVREH
jgi:hypothetical protein